MDIQDKVDWITIAKNEMDQIWSIRGSKGLPLNA